MTLPSLGDTVAALTRRPFTPAGASAGRMRTIAAFGNNPGALTMRIHTPEGLTAHAPLVVVLHGCTQTGEPYAEGAGWLTLADRFGFAVLCPEQSRGNNANLCFNWFVPEDIRRDRGETLSIRQMIAAMVKAHGLDGRRIYITGLSAGGAMAMAMLALFPEVFAAGAIIAGIPFGAATSVPEAFDRMRGSGLPAPEALAERIIAASPHAGPWPRLSVWQGTADNTVDPANAEAIVRSWALVQGLGEPIRAKVNGQLRLVWRDAQGKDAIEVIAVAGMGHGTPIASQGAEACGTPGPYMLEAGISSTRRIAAFWGIAPAVAEGPTPVVRQESGVEAMINGALRQAGLIR